MSGHKVLFIGGSLDGKQIDDVSPLMPDDPEYNRIIGVWWRDGIWDFMVPIDTMRTLGEVIAFLALEYSKNHPGKGGFQ